MQIPLGDTITQDPEPFEHNVLPIVSMTTSQTELDILIVLYYPASLTKTNYKLVKYNHDRCPRPRDGSSGEQAERLDSDRIATG